MAVKIKLKRLGKIREPYYRIVVADARTKRDGRAIEEIGKYHPKAEPSLIEVNSERVQHWLSVGAQPTDPVRVLLKITGDWQKFTGEPGTEGTLRTAEPRADKKERFEAAAKESQAGKAAKEGAKESKAASKASKPARSTAAKDSAAKDSAAKDSAAKDSCAPRTVPPRTAARQGQGPGRRSRRRAAAASEAPAEASSADAKRRRREARRGEAPPRRRPPTRSLPTRSPPTRRPRTAIRGAEPNVLEEALEHLVRGIVQYPDDVQVASRSLRRGSVLEVRVHPDDLGKVIGRGGRTARALRTVIGALADGRYVRIDLLDANEVR